ncbi:MAG: nuclear transport factor 2 family protein, partial [Pyrinomonadaceae bacterium]
MITTVEKWHELVKSRNARGLDSLLADDIIFYSPVVYTPQVGKAIAIKYLTAAFHVFFNET